MFAESSAASDQGGESDYDWIAGLPDEFAAEALLPCPKSTILLFGRTNGKELAISLPSQLKTITSKSTNNRDQQHGQFCQRRFGNDVLLLWNRDIFGSSRPIGGPSR